MPSPPALHTAAARAADLLKLFVEPSALRSGTGALAGSTPEEVALTVEQNVLTLEDRKTEKGKSTSCISDARSLKRQFMLAETRGNQGRLVRERLLIIDLVSEIPEAMKPRRIAINGPSAGNQIEMKAA